MSSYHPPKKVSTIFEVGDYDYSTRNTANVTLSATGSAPNANGVSLSGQVLTLQPASASFGGIISTGTQSIAGAKTFTSNVNTSGTIYQTSGSQIASSVLSDSISSTNVSLTSLNIAYVGTWPITYNKKGKMVTITFADLAFTAVATSFITYQLPVVTGGIYPAVKYTNVRPLSITGTNNTQAITVDTTGLITWNRTVTGAQFNAGTAYIIFGGAYTYLTA